ncbi:CHAT domain-containing protein [Leptolyngbya sp. 7M]|uniref:CHAT domain-containing protein n=1 Tax=Leptolyngbya sp. 7M TaxID=2812896 RepID=UPI001B8D4949|nr:CHAT domain-containing protein [Leptolyngbya sp. 7M]QYO65889.1 CHAT domain-containing protein [Leptolyngbya sp. 7M]
MLLLVLASVGIRGQSSPLATIRNSFNNGHFEGVVRLAPEAILRTRKAGTPATASELGVLKAQALMRLERYEEASTVLDEALTDAEQARQPRRIAAIYLARSAHARALRDFPSALKSARNALAAAASDPQIRFEYHLAIGRVMYSSGFDVAAIIWLEKAEKLARGLPMSLGHLDVLGHLSLAWAAKFNYARAIEYGEKLVKISEKTEFKYRHRLALYEFGGLLSSVGQGRKAKQMREKGLKLALTEKDAYQACLLLSPLILTSLYEGDVTSAKKHLLTLDRVDRDRRFLFEAILGNAVVAGLQGQKELSANYFKELETLKAHSDYLIPHWKAILAEKGKDWAGLIEQMKVLQKSTEESNFREDLLGIYFSLAKGYWGLGEQELAIEHARRAAAIFESDRPTGDTILSLSILETYHSVFRLLAEIEDKRGNTTTALELVDYSKARVLRDRIENSALRRKADLDSEVRKHVEELSTQLIDGGKVRDELAAIEKSVTLSLPQIAAERKLDLNSFDNKNLLRDTAVVSYFFTIGGQLRAYVIEDSKPVRAVELSLSEGEAARIAQSTRVKIRDRIFFKSDGNELYNRLLAPLSLASNHIVIVPDKALWKIPFHALSPDGESYLIEKRIVSYSPSVSMLLNELTQPVPSRKTIQVFANDSFQDRHLEYVNREAEKVGRIFSARPVIGATRRQFLSSAGESDILHFSMHAQADPNEPLESFLAFKAFGKDSGQITVQDLLSVRLKKQNLAFLASCETNNVLNGEGLVSIAWALLGSGSSSVISAQWEANDRSTELFTQKFYEQYRDGTSAAKALQAVSISMIQNKSTGSHEPYFWAAFFLLGDHR